MKVQNRFIKILLTGLVLGSSLSAIARGLPFKLAIIADAQGSKEILSGDFNNSIESLNKRSSDRESFAKHMGLCAAYIKTSNADKSESACSAAIDSANLMNWHSKKGIYLKSLSYSNRGISRYMDNDISGAIDDLAMAVSIDINSITKSNLIFAKKALIKSEETNTVALSD